MGEVLKDSEDIEEGYTILFTGLAVHLVDDKNVLYRFEKGRRCSFLYLNFKNPSQENVPNKDLQKSTIFDFEQLSSKDTTKEGHSFKDLMEKTLKNSNSIIKYGDLENIMQIYGSLEHDNIETLKNIFNKSDESYIIFHSQPSKFLRWKQIAVYNAGERDDSYKMESSTLPSYHPSN